MIKHRIMVYQTADLCLGFKGRSCSFEHRPLPDRTPEAQAAYQRLRNDLLANGMKHPLITYCGHILIGMRRFEILKDRQDEFKCVEVLEDVRFWERDDIKRLQAFKRELYGDSIDAFEG